MEYLTTVEMSEKWNITSRRIGVLCAKGRVEGAIKKGKTWLIPADATKPADARRKNIKGACGVWSGDETIAPKGFRNMTREL